MIFLDNINPKKTRQTHKIDSNQSINVHLYKQKNRMKSLNLNQKINFESINRLSIDKIYQVFYKYKGARLNKKDHRE